jgi:hypothetical protein
MNFKSKTVLVWDSGLFAEFAATLTKQFGRVLYFAPWTSSAPKSNEYLIGRGIEGVERVTEPWSHIDEVDLFVFADVYEGPLQEYLAKQGKRVWGCRGSDWLEIDRPKSKEQAAALGIDVGPYTVIQGLPSLRRYLKRNDDRYIKISVTRGDMETFHAPNYADVEIRLNEIEHRLGAGAKLLEFVVEKGISPAVEVGYDGYSIDGKFPNGALVGVEVKDRAYVGKTMRYSQLPDGVKSVNEKLAPVLKTAKHRGFMSTEIRLTPDGKAYLIDPCQRAASPPSELYQNMISNLAEVMWFGAAGEVVEPEYASKWGAQVLLLSEWADQNWQQVSFPAEIREHVKLRNFTVIDGEYYVIPQWNGLPEIGAVVAMGDTAAEAIEECKRLAKMVDGYSIEKPVEALDEALINLKKSLKDAGGAGSDDGPDPLHRKAEAAMLAGRISKRAYEKMIARAS